MTCLQFVKQKNFFFIHVKYSGKDFVKEEKWLMFMYKL